MNNLISHLMEILTMSSAATLRLPVLIFATRDDLQRAFLPHSIGRSWREQGHLKRLRVSAAPAGYLHFSHDLFHDS